MANATLYLAFNGNPYRGLNGCLVTSALPFFTPVVPYKQLSSSDALCISKPALLALPGRLILATDSPQAFTNDPGGIYWSVWQGSDWGPGTLVPGVGSAWGPALAQWGTGALMVWNGVGSDTRIWCSQYNEQANAWSTQFLTQLPGGAPIRSGSTPAIVNFQGELLMVWRGEGSNDNLYYAVSADGLHWQGNRAIPGAASVIQPAITVFNGVPVIAFRGGLGDDGIYISTYNKAVDAWSGVQKTGPFGSSHGPSLAVFQGKLFMTWKGGDNNYVYWSETADASSPPAWSSQGTIAGALTTVGPGVAVF